MRLILAVAVTSLLIGCAQQSGTLTNYGSSGEVGSLLDGAVQGYGNPAHAAAQPPSLAGCLSASGAAHRGVPSLASRVIGRRAAGGRVEIGLQEVLSYAAMVVNASGGDNIAAAELISMHEASDTNCFRQQANHLRQQDPGRGSKYADMYKKANGILGQAYSTLKTYTASGDVGDLSERLTRSYIPVGLTLPAT